MCNCYCLRRISSKRFSSSNNTSSSSSSSTGSSGSSSGIPHVLPETSQPFAQPQ